MRGCTIERSRRRRPEVKSPTPSEERPMMQAVGRCRWLLRDSNLLSASPPDVILRPQPLYELAAILGEPPPIVFTDPRIQAVQKALYNFAQA